jgi:hypothetical protein
MGEHEAEVQGQEVGEGVLVEAKPSLGPSPPCEQAAPRCQALQLPYLAPLYPEHRLPLNESPPPKNSGLGPASQSRP